MFLPSLWLQPTSSNWSKQGYKFPTHLPQDESQPQSTRWNKLRLLLQMHDNSIPCFVQSCLLLSLTCFDHKALLNKPPAHISIFDSFTPKPGLKQLFHMCQTSGYKDEQKKTRCGKVVTKLIDQDSQTVNSGFRLVTYHLCDHDKPLKPQFPNLQNKVALLWTEYLCLLLPLPNSYVDPQSPVLQYSEVGISEVGKVIRS